MTEPSAAAKGREGRGRGPAIHLFGMAGFNLGDDAIALGASDALTRHLHGARIAAACIDPGSFQARYGRPELPVDRRSLPGVLRFARSISRASVVVLGGGTLIQDKLGLTLLRGNLAYTQQIAWLAKALGKPLMTLPIGVDELQGARALRYARAVLRRVDALWVRDDRSAELAVRYGARERPRVAPDPAFLIDDLASGPAARRPFPRYAVVSLVHEGLALDPLLRALTPALMALLDEEAFDGVVLLAMDRRSDQEVARYRAWLGAFGRHRERVTIAAPDDAREAFRLVRDADLLIGMRLHAMIFGLGHTPTFGVSRTTKTDSFLAEHELAGCRFDRPPEARHLHSALVALRDDEAALARQRRRRAKLRADADEAIRELAGACARALAARNPRGRTS